MTGPGADRITLDRTNLMRLADLLAELPIPRATAEIRAGFNLAVECIRGLAVEMPHLYGNDGCPIFLPTGDTHGD